MNLSASSLTYRKQQEILAQALIEKSRRQAKTDYLDLLTWTMTRRTLLKPAVLFDISDHRFLEAIYRCKAQQLVIYKASQMGASEFAVSYSLHAADERNATVLYVFPTDTHVSDFSTARIGPAIEASPYLAEIVVDAGGPSANGVHKRGADRVTLKRIRDRFIYLRGGQVRTNGQAPQLKSIDADVLVLDEVDEMDPRAPAIAEKRLGHSIIAEQRWLSTPTYPGIGIHAKWLESDQREWFIRCEACGKRQAITIDSVVTEMDGLGRPVAWNRDTNGKAVACCKKCGAILDRLGPGEWVAGYPRNDIAGFHLTKFFSSRASLDGIVSALMTTDETKRREAFNQDLGEPYTPRGGKITDDVLDDCKREYAHGPVQGEETIAGIDVGKVLNIVVRGPMNLETGERPQRFAGEVESFEAAGNLLRQYNTGRVVIDALPETRKARELQASFPRGIVWLAYYVTQKVGTKRADPMQWDEAEGVVNLDRTRTLDLTFSRFYEHSNTLPANAKDVPGYYDHIKALIRVLEERPDGEKVASYMQNAADHFAHAENYCTVASERIGTNFFDYLRRKYAEKEETDEKTD